MRRRFTPPEIDYVYQSTDGRCHICRTSLVVSNYGKLGFEGSWEVDHSNPIANGGTNFLRNLKPACISCNRSKGALPSKAVRQKHGFSRAPLSADKKKKVNESNVVGFSVLGSLIGLVFGPFGWAIGAVIGATVGESIEVESK